MPEAESVRLYYATANTLVPHEIAPNFFEFPLEVADALEYLLDEAADGEFRPVSTLPGLEDADKVHICRTLYAAGVLLARTDAELLRAAAAAKTATPHPAAALTVKAAKAAKAAKTARPHPAAVGKARKA